MHAALRRRRLEVQVLAGAPLSRLPLRRLCEVRSALFSFGASVPRIPPWQRPAMHSSRKGDHARAAPAGGSFSDGGRDVTASIRSCEDRRAGAAPVGLPISKKRAMPKSSRRRLADPLLPGASPGARSTFGAIVQKQDDAMALRRSGCDFPWLI